jgi:hypothetical protein
MADSGKTREATSASAREAKTSARDRKIPAPYLLVSEKSKIPSDTLTLACRRRCLPLHRRPPHQVAGAAALLIKPPPSLPLPSAALPIKPPPSASSHNHRCLPIRRRPLHQAAAVAACPICVAALRTKPQPSLPPHPPPPSASSRRRAAFPICAAALRIKQPQPSLPPPSTAALCIKPPPCFLPHLRRRPPHQAAARATEHRAPPAFPGAVVAGAFNDHRRRSRARLRRILSGQEERVWASTKFCVSSSHNKSLTLSNHTLLVRNFGPCR